MPNASEKIVCLLACKTNYISKFLFSDAVYTLAIVMVLSIISTIIILTFLSSNVYAFLANNNSFPSKDQQKERFTYAMSVVSIPATITKQSSILQ